ncbi:class I lanthipeptide [Taibaiella helva]|uniref:class I lanthipeptide n=1 Tax=Taibaiella helva TaxID=2301235 RepID=UPI000E57D2D8|nr:class I lanthipeptide [Taibaiella helva]
MKKITLNTSKLQLGKEKIGSLTKQHMTDVVGGGNDANPNNPTAQVTATSDVPTYSHDDGSWCISASRLGCTCGGR